MRAEQLVAVGVLAVVARGDDDDNPGPIGALHGLAHGIVGAALEHRPAQRQVDDPDLVAVAILNRPVNRVGHVAGIAAAVGAEHLQIDDVCAGRHAAGGVLRVDPGGRDDPRHVRAVAVVVAQRALAPPSRRRRSRRGPPPGRTRRTSR